MVRLREMADLVGASPSTARNVLNGRQGQDRPAGRETDTTLSEGEQEMRIGPEVSRGTSRFMAGALLVAMLALASTAAQAAGAASAAGDDSADWFTFAPPRDQYGPAMLDLRSVLNEPVAGSRGRVAARDGDLVFSGTGEKVRFWGVVDEPWVWPTKKADIDYLSRRLAKEGVNLVRLHIARGDGPPTRFLDTVQYTVHSLKQQGIYSYLSWFCTACYGDWTNRLYFDPEPQQEYEGWVRTILGSDNPYTGMPLAKDPAVAAVELIDEDSLFFWTFNPTRDVLKDRMPLLEKRFGEWLTAKYGSLQKAVAAWGPGKYPEGDNLPAGLVAMYPAGTLTDADWAVAGRNPERAQDQARFMTELMRNWYGGMKGWMRNEVGYDGLVVASNWKTADERVLGPLDEYTNLADDVTARNTYFGGQAAGPNASYRIDPGQTYRDQSLLKDPEQAILMHMQCAGYPHIMTEGGYAMPNRFRTEEPLLAASYFSLQGVDGYCAFRIQPDWAGRPDKWPIQTPATLGQYPAASIIYRRGYIEEGPVVINDALKLDDLYALKGATLSQPLGLDAIQAARVPEGAQAEVASLPGVDPLSFYVGRVERTIGEDPGKSSFMNTGKLIDRDHKVVRSATGQLALDYGRGVVTVNAPCAQGAAGFLAAVGAVTLSDVTLDLQDEYGAVVVVSLDGKPLAESGRMLLQVMTEEKHTGWKTEPAPAGGRGGGAAGGAPSLRIVNAGGPPLLVRKMAGTVSLKRADAPTLKVTALDFNGYARQQVQGGAGRIALLPDCLYYIIEK